MILADLAKHAFDGFGMQSRVLHFFEFLIGRIKVILGPLAELMLGRLVVAAVALAEADDAAHDDEDEVVGGQLAHHRAATA